MIFNYYLAGSNLNFTQMSQPRTDLEPKSLLASNDRDSSGACMKLYLGLWNKNKNGKGGSNTEGK